MFVLQYVLGADDCMGLYGIPVLYKEKSASLVTEEVHVMFFDIKINQQLMTMDTDSFSVFAQKNRDFPL